MGRFYAGCATWADYDLLGSLWVDGWRADLLTKLPLAVARPVTTVHRVTSVPTADVVTAVVSAPIGREFTSVRAATPAESLS